jgi:hypothetical protein
MEFSVHPDALALFNASVRITIGDGARVLFWEDPWVDGLTVESFAPDLLKLVRPGIRRSRTVQSGLAAGAWVQDITGELSIAAVVQYLKLWHAVRDINVGDGADSFTWKWTANGQFSSRTAYRAFFFGRTALPGAAEVWHSFAPFKEQFHAWLALRKRCWTADRLARRGLPTHALCPLCAAEAETLDHLSLRCSFAVSIWTGVCLRLGFAIPIPTPISTLPHWWPDAVANLSRSDRKTANSIIMLTLRAIWLERNARVFDHTHSTAARVLDGIIELWGLWVSSRRRGGSPGDVT